MAELQDLLESIDTQPNLIGIDLAKGMDNLVRRAALRYKALKNFVANNSKYFPALAKMNEATEEVIFALVLMDCVYD